MRAGIVGLPNVGKSTLFNAITKAGAEVANYPFCTIEPNVGRVNVNDKRLDWLEELYNAAKKTPAFVELVDIAGLVKGASKGEGLGNKFLANIRETDAILHVVRCFTDNSIIHVDGAADPLRDAAIINLELLLADLEFIEKRLDKTRKLSKSGDKKLLAELNFLERMQSHLEAEKPARSFPFTANELTDYVPELFLLTLKPVLYVANVAEDELETPNANVRELQKLAAEEGALIIEISARLEDELSSLTPEDAAQFMSELGLKECGLDKLIAASYALLGLISFLTAGPKEVRAWTIKAGSKAPQAAGKIHSDFEKGFIRAEIVAYDELRAAGSMAVARERGLLRSEGKEYVMKDGDVTLFRFNV